MLPGVSLTKNPSRSMGAKRRQQAWGCLKTVVLQLVWARKGGAFKDWFRSSNRQFRLFYRYIRSLRCSSDDDRIWYGEQQLSFDETPMFRFNLMRPATQEEEEEESDAFLQRREEAEVVAEEGVDAKAEEFIAKFHEQMRLQRQISLVQYNERLFIVE